MLVQGRVDVPLNETGREQAQKTRQSLEGIRFDLAFCSPLLRAKETAEILLEGTGLAPIEDARLLEIYYGEEEGKNRKEEPFVSRKKDHFRRFPGGESYFDACARIYDFLREIENAYPERNVLVVAHGGISRIVHSYFHDMGNEEFEGHIIGNCVCERYDWPHRDFPRSLSPWA